jgi:hypothetical protein
MLDTRACCADDADMAVTCLLYTICQCLFRIREQITQTPFVMACKIVTDSIVSLLLGVCRRDDYVTASF